MDILLSIVVLLGLGIVLGFGLAVAAKILYVKEDERIAEVAKRLPNYNCGSERWVVRDFSPLTS